MHAEIDPAFSLGRVAATNTRSRRSSATTTQSGFARVPAAVDRDRMDEALEKAYVRAFRAWR